MIEVHPDIKNLVAAGRLPAILAPKVSALQPGTYVFSKTWGAGQVAEWDTLGDRMIVDFETKKGHAVKLEFSVKMMDPVEETHFYARRFADKPALLKMAQEQPAEFLTNVLASHGGKLAIELFEDAVRGKVVPEGKYKTWWDNTKKALRGNPQFIIPSKRNVPLELRVGDVTAADALESDVINSRDLKSKTKALEAIIKETAQFEKAPERLDAMAKHVEEAAQQNLRLKSVESIDLILLRDDLAEKIPSVKEKITFTLGDALGMLQDKVQEFIGGLSASKQGRIFDNLATSHGGKADWVEKAAVFLNKLNARSLTELVKVINKHEGGERLVAWMKSNIASRNLSSEALAWVCRERKGLAKEVFSQDIGGALMSAVERDHFDEDKKTNRVMDVLVEDMNLIPDLVGSAQSNVVLNFARQMMLSSAFEELSKRSVMARIIKLAPEVQELVDEHGDDQSGPTETLYVSWPSLEAKKAAFDHLVNVEIPKNREEISIARSYGDLRENSEYKFAKEQQKVLTRRQMEFDRDLNRAVGTDFSDVLGEVVGMGTVVVIKDTATGKSETYTILGAWDSEPAKHILSYQTEIAKALGGKAVGETANMPSDETGSREVEVVSVTKWFKG
jgi:transcription elongation GreA/GreB family factor